MESHRRVEISATTSSEAERLATLIAFHEGVPITIVREDGAEFAYLAPIDLQNFEQVHDYSSRDAINA